MSFERNSYSDYMLSHFINMSIETGNRIIISTPSSLIYGTPFRGNDMKEGESDFFNSFSQINEKYMDMRRKFSTQRSGLHLKDVTIQSHGGPSTSLPYMYIVADHIVGISLENLI